MGLKNARASRRERAARLSIAATPAQLEFVLDAYRARWLIEEYFKAIKTGCKYEQRQLESGEALLRALGVFAVLAWRLLVLRFIERTVSDAPVELVATTAEIEVLRAPASLARHPDAGRRTPDAGRRHHSSHVGAHLSVWRPLSDARAGGQAAPFSAADRTRRAQLSALGHEHL